MTDPDLQWLLDAARFQSWCAKQDPPKLGCDDLYLIGLSRPQPWLVDEWLVRLQGDVLRALALCRGRWGEDYGIEDL